MSIGTLYVSDTAQLSQTNFHSIPFNNAKIEYKSDSADSLSFRSNQPSSMMIHVEKGMVSEAKSTRPMKLQVDCMNMIA